jgi:hypothetical protein
VSSSTEYRYNRLTWAEMNEAIARQPAEWREWPLAARRDFHARPVQSQIQW